jgi:hypothetical protein
MDFHKYFETAFQNPKFEELSNFNQTILENYDNLSIQVSLPPSVSDNEDLYLGETFNMLRQQISMEVQKKILNYINKSDNQFFIDLIDVLNPDISKMPLYSDSHGNLMRRFTFELMKISPKNIISNGRIISDYITDSPAFVYEYHTTGLSTNINNTFTRSGKISNINVYLDSFMKYTDDFILTYDDISYDINNFKLEITRDSRFAPILQVSSNFAFKVNNPGLIWVIENTNSRGFNQYKSTLRDKKIDNLLN